MLVRLLVVAFLTSAPCLVLAQAHSGCPERPKTVAAMHSCYRPLLVFSPAGSDPRFRQQETTLDNAADDMMDRFMLLVPVLESAKGYQPPLDAPSALLPARELEHLRRRFHVRPHQFKVVLLDEDGADSLSSGEPVDMTRIDGLIDSMPRRKEEMQRPDSN